MKNTVFTTLLFVIGIASVHGQFGIRIGDSSFTAKGYQAVYPFESGQLLIMTDNSPARNEGYIFIDSATGELISSFSLDSRHGAVLTPDSEELLMAGSDGSHRTMARYSPSTLELIERVGINLGDNLANTSGIGGNFEPTPDGHFIFNGTDLPGSVNFISKYDHTFNQLWSKSFQYNGQFSLTGVEAYPLPDGDIGFYVFFNALNPQTSRLEITDVFGLLDGSTGDLKWTFTYQPPLGAINNRLEDFRFTFGSDGSFFAHAAVQIDISNISAPLDRSRAKILRINSDGSLAYGKTVQLPDAVVLGENYMDGPALLHFSYNDEDNTQFVVIDSSGNLMGTTSVDNHLSAGDGDLTATRRSGSDFAFVRASFSPGGENLARINLTDGSMEFQQLPISFPGNPVYEAVGSISAYPVAPFNSPGGFPSVSPVLAAEVLNGLSQDYRIDIIELPTDGSFPSCITYTPSTIVQGSALSVELADIEIIDLENGWEVSEYSGISGFTPSDVSPDLAALNPDIQILCEDDGSGPQDIHVNFVRTGPETGELSFTTVSGTSYSIQRSGILDGQSPFSDMQTVVGTGDVFTMTIPLSDDQEYFRVIIP